MYTSIMMHVMVTINVQQFRSRYAKYVHYNYTRVVCECHGSSYFCRSDRLSRQVEDMVNTLDDCDILEKAILVLGDLIIVHIQYFMIILNHSALMNYLAYVFDALV